MDRIAPVGHELIRSQTHALLQEGALHTTLLFSGIEGIGKKIAALELARGILCEQDIKKRPRGGCGTCRSCVLLQGSNHPDRILIECGDKDIWNLDALRQLLYSLHLKPFQGMQRVVIFNDAENLSLQACNLLLKTLEEPRPGNWFILITSNPTKLPITLRSRSQVWSFATLKPLELMEIIKRLDPDDSSTLSTNDIAHLSDGSIGVAKTLLEYSSDALEVRDLLQGVLQGDGARALQVASEWAKERGSLRLKLTLCRTFSRALLLAATDPDTQSRVAVFLTNVLSAERLIFDRNINAQLVLQKVLFALLPSHVLGAFTAIPNSDTLIDTFGV